MTKPPKHRQQHASVLASVTALALLAGAGLPWAAMKGDLHRHVGSDGASVKHSHAHLGAHTHARTLNPEQTTGRAAASRPFVEHSAVQTATQEPNSAAAHSHVHRSGLTHHHHHHEARPASSAETETRPSLAAERAAERAADGRSNGRAGKVGDAPRRADNSPLELNTVADLWAWGSACGSLFAKVSTRPQPSSLAALGARHGLERRNAPEFAEPWCHPKRGPPAAAA